METRPAEHGKEPADDERLRVVLSRWVKIRSEGGEADLAGLCGGDRGLEERLRQVVALESLVRSKGAEHGRLGGEVPSEEGRFGEFRLMTQIGMGASGQVYLAEQVGLKRLVALKIFDRAAIKSDAADVRIRREAHIAAALEHSNIVPVYASGKVDGLDYLAMKWLSGPSLDALEEPMAAREAAALIATVARALGFAHDAGVVHRDIKPANIILDGEVPYVADFGLARRDSDTVMTRSGTVAGTMAYLAPELLAGIQTNHGPLTDIYALGATLYHLLAGRPPFVALDSRALIHQILLREPEALPLSPDDRDLETIVRRAISKDPDERFPSASAFAQDLERFVARDGIESRRPGRAKRVLRILRRHPRAMAALATTILIVTSLVTILWIRESRDQRRLDATLEGAAAALQRRDFAALDALLPELEADSRSEDKAARLRGFRNALVRLDDAIDSVSDGVAASADLKMEDLQDLLSSHGAASHDVARALVLRALSRYYDDDIEGALKLLSEAEDKSPARHGMASLIAAIRGGGSRPAGASPGDVEDPWTEAMAERIAMVPASERRRSLELSLSRAPGDFPSLYLLAVLDSEEQKLDAALAGFRALDRKQAPRPGVIRNLVRIAIIQGRLDDAERDLARLDAYAASPASDTLRINLLVRRGKMDDARQLADSGVETWRDSAQFLLLAAQLASSEGNSALARERLEMAAGVRRSSPPRQEARAELVVADLSTRVHHDSLTPIRIGEEMRSDVLELQARAVLLLRETKSKAARATLQWVLAWCERLLDPSAREQSIVKLEAALSEDPMALRPAMDLIGLRLSDVVSSREWIEGAASKFETRPAASNLDLRHAKETASRVVGLELRGRRIASPEQVQLARRALAAFAWHEGDRGLCLRSAASALDGEQDLVWQTALRALEEWASRSGL